MIKRKILSFALALFAFMAFSGVSAFAAEGDSVQRTFEKDPDRMAQLEQCAFDAPDEKYYSSEIVTIRKKLRVEPGEKFRVKVFMKNTGNMPWHSDESICGGGRTYLNTSREDDVRSIFYQPGAEGWVSESKVGMDQEKVMPGEIASFTFYTVAGDDEDILRQYMVQTFNGDQRNTDEELTIDVMVGDTGEDAESIRKKMMFASKSGSVRDVPVDGDFSLLIDLGKQSMHLKLDGYVVRSFPVNTGARATPTPVGTHTIMFKQEMRVGYKPPHYIMPLFMGLNTNGRGFHGYGLHALPSLGTPHGGVFWTEAVDHITSPNRHGVSHGCVRMLKEDIELLHEVLPVGAEVEVVSSSEYEGV